MSKTIKRIVGVALTLCLLLGCLTGLTRLTIRKGILTRLAPALEYADTTDVLFFGSSNVFDGISPMEIYKEFGITSYNCGTAASTIPASYWMMMNMLDYVEPRVIVLDCYKLGYEEAISGFSAISYLDIFPLSATKISAIMDFRNMGISNADAFALLWPFSEYHARWSELEQGDFSPEYNTLLKGSRMVVNVATPATQDNYTDKLLDNTDDCWGVEYLTKFIEECRKRDIELLLVHLPFPAGEGDYKGANTVQLLADEYGVDYINFLTMELLNYDTDMFDSGTHSNLSGARKISEYLGRYISENYDVQDRRGEAGYEQWNEDLEEYKQYMLSVLESSNYLKNTLMLMQDKDFSGVITLEKGSPIYEDEIVMELIANAAGGQALPGLEEAKETGESYLLVIDKVSDRLWEFVGQQEAEVAETGLGQLSYINGALYIDGQAVEGAGDRLAVANCYVIPNDDAGKAFGCSFVEGEDTYIKAY